MDHIKIDSRSGLRSYLEKFEEKGLHIIALDIEADSNLHAYGEKLCLVQIFDGVESVIIDPFRTGNDALRLLFENTKILKVMYDASGDLSLLKNTADMEIKSILDLRPAVELIGYEKKDLHSVIAFELGIFLEKKKRFQTHNWINRPVSDLAIDYALNDVIHLLTLKDVILAKLYARKLFEPFFLKNLQVQNRDYTRNPEDKYRKINGYGRLRDDKKAVFRRVFDVRENYAKLHNMTPHNVIQKADLINIVNDPKCIDKIKFSRRFSKELVREIVHELKAVVGADR
ncbi:MAG: hypothetical protein OEU95_04525 [Nitrospirota bacterium]|nr:hypothetical protein [Nitrospirota bacterium]